MEPNMSTKLKDTATPQQRQRKPNGPEVNSNPSPGWSDMRKFLEDIVTMSDMKARSTIQEFMSYEKSQQLLLQKDTDNTTVLHLALSILSFRREEEKNFLKWIIKMVPKAILVSKSNMFQGQLPLHMAICQRDMFLVELVLTPLSEDDKMKCLHTKATGKEFALTVMAAELPLSVAALTGNMAIVDYLLQHGAKPTKKNSKGENVLHSIITYAYKYPDKAKTMLEMMTFLMEKSTIMNELEKKYQDEHFLLRMLFQENNRGRSPLQVALQLGQLDMFKYILQKVYVYNHGHGLFDVEEYDMTDVDKSLTLVSKGGSELPSKPQAGEKDPFPLDCLFFLNTKMSIAFLNYPPLSRLIRRRWFAYKLIFISAFFLHLGIMIMLTVAAVLRAERRPIGGMDNSTDGMPDYIFSFQVEGVSDQFVITSGFINLIVAILYIMQEVLRLCKGRLPWRKEHFFSNSNNMFRLLIVIFALSLVADCIVTWFPVDEYYDYEEIPFLLAILSGWFFLLFFLRANRFFCQFTSLIQKAMLDIIRFSVIIIIELVAFTTVMYVLIRGSKLDADETRTEFQQHWFKALFLVFQQIFGIGDLPQSHIRNRLIVNIVYICFIVMTSVLMLNALIAIMSNMCTELFNSNDGIAHLRLHQYAIIRFFESILPDRYVMNKAREQMVRSEKMRYDPKTRTWDKQERFVLPMDSLRTISNDSITISPESAKILQINHFNTTIETTKNYELSKSSSSILGSISNVIFPDARKRNITKPDSIEIHHLRLGLCDKCHNQYVLPRSKLNKIVPSK